MVLKLLIPALVIAAVYFYGRHQASKAARVPVRAPQPAAAEEALPLKWKIIVIILVGGVTIGAGLFFYNGWSRGNQIVEIRVVHTGNGETIRYRARQNAVHSRSFTTLEGLQVTVADVERMEISPVVK